jgi:hypothetical protein
LRRKLNKNKSSGTFPAVLVLQLQLSYFGHVGDFRDPLDQERVVGVVAFVHGTLPHVQKKYKTRLTSHIVVVFVLHVPFLVVVDESFGDFELDLKQKAVL